MSISAKKKEERKKLQKEIGLRISLLSKELGKEALKICDIRLTHGGEISMLTSGKARPSMELLYYLLIDFKVNLNWLFTGVKKEPMFLLNEEKIERHGGPKGNPFSLAKIGERIEKARHLLSLSLSEIGLKSNSDAPTVSRVENGNIKPSLNFLSSLLIDFKVNLNWLFSGKGSKFKN